MYSLCVYFHDAVCSHRICMYCLELLVYYCVMFVIIFYSCIITTDMCMSVFKVTYKHTGLGEIMLFL